MIASPRFLMIGSTYDAGRRRVVLFGGVSTAGLQPADTWEWDGSTWTQRTPSIRPPAGAGHRLASDDVRQRILLFGGSNATTGFADTWEWDGTTWAERLPQTRPPARAGHALAW